MEVFDPLRKKNVKLTPEEGVRQGFIRWLNESVGVPMTMMNSECAFKFNGLTYRADILVFDRMVQPMALVECKAPDVKLDEKVMEQVLRYVRTIKVKFIFITNGQTTYLCKWNPDASDYVFTTEIPTYAQMMEQ